MLVLSMSLLALETFGKHKIKAPLLHTKAPSLELRLTQLGNIIAFKAHLNLFITIIHSPELSKSSHQSCYSGKKRTQRTLFMKMRSSIMQGVDALLSIYQRFDYTTV